MKLKKKKKKKDPLKCADWTLVGRWLAEQKGKKTISKEGGGPDGVWEDSRPRPWWPSICRWKKKDGSDFLVRLKHPKTTQEAQ